MYHSHSKCVQNEFLRLSPSGWNEKTPWGTIPTGSVSYHHFGWAFPEKAKRRVTEFVQTRSKRGFSTFPIGKKQKKITPFRTDPPRSVYFSCHHFGWAFPGSAKSRVDEGRPIALKTRWGETKKTPLGSNSTRSVSYHHFGWAFPSSAKSRIDEYLQIEFKTLFRLSQ